MRHLRRLRLLAVLAVLLAGAVTAAQQPAPLTTPIPADAAITTGQFANGLRYYIRANRKPEKRAELRLVVNVGSLQEADDQRGLAHFVEHMAFNGTKNFPKQALVQFLESLGMRFGADVNASTNFDETTFMLQVPTDRDGVLDRSFLILEDWAHAVSFDGDEIDKERGVVLEEWRLGRGASARLLDAQLPVLLKGSRYAERLPIGTVDVLRGFRHDRLKAFYSDWYRPDLMAVVAVGDFDPAAVKAMIDAHFARLPKAAAPKPREVYPVPDQPGTAYAIAADKEQPMTTVEVYGKLPVTDPGTIGAYRQDIVEGLFAGMLSARFGEITQRADAPFLGAFTSRGAFVRSKRAATLSAMVKEDGVTRGLEGLYAELARVAQFGFTATELDRQKQNILRSLERAVAEKANQVSASLANEYVRNFTTREPIPGIVYEQQLYQRFLPEITLAEVNGLARTWMPADNRVVVVSAPEKPGLTLPTEAQLAAAMAAAASRPLTAYVDSASAAPFFGATPTPGAVVKTATRPAAGLTEWTLANGVTVVLKPTTFKEDEIIFRAVSPGGLSGVPEADWIPASTASGVVGASGLGAMSAIDLRKALTGKIASASASIGMYDQGLAGSASKKDLETMFQLIYLRMTAPRADRALFDTIRTQTKAVLANQAADPDFAFGTALQSALTGDDFRSRPVTTETIDRMDLDRSMAFYRSRFADAASFTFVFAGSFDVEAMRPLVEKYLGSLPATHAKATWRDTGVKTPAGVVQKVVERGLEPKSQTAIIFSGAFPYTQTERIAIRAMAYVLENRLRERLREDLGGTYSVSASASPSKIPREEYTFDISFGSAPERAQALTDAVFTEIARLKAEGPTAKEVGDVTETFLRDYETNMKSNSYWVTQVLFKYQYGEDPATVLGLPEYYRRIDAAMIRKAAADYLNTGRYVSVRLMPEKKSPAPSPR